MIFIGKGGHNKFKVGVAFVSGKRKVSKIDWIPNYYLVLRLGKRRYWVGYNRLKRIVRGRLYELDGKQIKYPGGRVLLELGK